MPPRLSVLRPRRVAALPLLAGCALLAPLAAVGGCAKVPTITETDETDRRLLQVRLTTRAPLAQLNPESGRQNFYFVVVNLTDDPNAPGPIPQLFPPYSNGIAVARIPGNVGMVGFVQFGGGIADQPRVFRAPRDTTITDRIAYRLAENTFYPDYVSQDLGGVDVPGGLSDGGRTLSFQVDLRRFRLDPNAPLPAYVQINLIATDNVPSNSPTDQPKLWDAIGDGRATQNTHITLQTTQSSQPITSADGTETAEPNETDVRDRVNGPAFDSPSLDLTGWSLQIR